MLHFGGDFCICGIFVVFLHPQLIVLRAYMSQELKIQLFENAKIRVVWDNEKEEYYFSVVDVVRALTDSADGRKYWNKLKQRLRDEGNESVTNCHQLKLPAADGKKYLTDVADLEGVFRIVQSIPSKKAEALKLWLGRSVVTSQKASDYIRPIEETKAQELPFDDDN